MKNLNGVPGSGSTTATSMSLQMKNDQFRRMANNFQNGGLHSYGSSSSAHLVNNSIESSNNMLVTVPPGSGNGRRPAVGRGFNKNCCLNLRLPHFWLPL